MKVTLWVMLSIGMIAWLVAVVWPGDQLWMIVAAAVLVAYSVYMLLMERWGES